MSLLEEIQRHERKMEDREYCLLLLRLRVCVTVMIVLTITLSLKWKLCFFLFFLDSISLPDARGGIAFLFLQHTGSNVNDFVCVWAAVCLLYDCTFV